MRGIQFYSNYLFKCYTPSNWLPQKSLNNIWSNSWALHGPVKLTHKLSSKLFSKSQAWFVMWLSNTRKTAVGPFHMYLFTWKVKSFKEKGAGRRRQKVRERERARESFTCILYGGSRGCKPWGHLWLLFQKFGSLMGDRTNNTGTGISAPHAVV